MGWLIIFKKMRRRRRNMERAFLKRRLDLPLFYKRLESTVKRKMCRRRLLGNLNHFFPRLT